MAKKRTQTETASVLTSSLIVKKDYFEAKVKERIALGQQLFDRAIQTVPEMEQLREDYYSWNDFNSELLKVSFDQPDNEYRSDYDNCTNKFIYSGYNNYTEQLEDYKNDIKKKKVTLERLVAKLPLINSKIVEPPNLIDRNYREDSELINNKVFIVHGQNAEKKFELFVTLQALGLEPIILHEQPNGGRTIIEKFEEYSDVGYAVVLLTDDDEGKSKKEDDYKLRARQNVILELGFFIGRLGRAKVCALYSENVELPNDISGLVYTPLDVGGSWKFGIAKELKTAGYSIDLNRLA